MSYLVYFGLFAIQLTSILATQPLPLRCFLQDDYFLAVFNKGNVLASPYIPATNPVPLDNLKLDYLKIAQDDLVLEAKDILIEGIRDAILDDFGINLNTNISYITFHSDLFMKYLYKADGSLLFLPINGEGVAEIFIKNIQGGMVVPFDIIDANGRKYIELKSYNYWYDVRDNAKFNISNLYYGDKEKSDTMLYLMNQNWKFMTIHYGKSFVEKVMEYMFNAFKNYFLSMPLRDFATC